MGDALSNTAPVPVTTAIDVPSIKGPVSERRAKTPHERLRPTGRSHRRGRTGRRRDVRTVAERLRRPTSGDGSGGARHTRRDRRRRAARPDDARDVRRGGALRDPFAEDRLPGGDGDGRRPELRHHRDGVRRVRHEATSARAAPEDRRTPAPPGDARRRPPGVLLARGSPIRARSGVHGTPARIERGVHRPRRTDRDTPDRGRRRAG